MRRLSHLLLLLVLLFVGSSQTAISPPGNTLLSEAQMLFDSAHYDRALQRGQEALQVCAVGEPEAAACLLLLGDVFLETGEWDAAYQQYNSALSIYAQKLGPRDLSVAAVFNRIGEYYYKTADYDKAATIYQKALEIREAKLGAAHEWVADGYNNLGNCQVGLGNYATATALHQKALAIRKGIYPAGHVDLATSFNNLGNCAYLSGDDVAAYQYFEKALTIREKAYGAEHPKTAQVLNNLGNACVALGRKQEAIQYYQRALAIRRRDFGDKHPVVASTLENIADLIFENGDYIAALDFYRQAYAIQQATQGQQSPAAASLWHNIGLCYQYEGDFERALSHHLAAEPILLAALGAAHPLMAGLYNNLGNCYVGKKEFEKASIAFQRALHIFQGAKPQQLASIALVYSNLGTTCLGKKEAKQALIFFQRALAYLHAAELDDAGQSAIYQKNIGLTFDHLGRWEEARQAFEQAINAANAADPMTSNAILDAWGTVLCQRGMHERDTSLLRQAIAVFEKSRQRSDSLRVQLGSPGARQRWLELQFPAHASAMEACYALWEKTGETNLLEKAFGLAERNKSMQLLEQLRKEQAEETLGLPDTLLVQERYLNAALNRQEKALLAANGTGNTREIQSAEIALAETRQAQVALQQQLESDYPDYFRRRYDRQTASIASVQQTMLAGGQALLEYFVSDSAIFIFVVTPTDFRCLRLARDFPLDDWVAALRHSMQAYPNAGEQAAIELTKAYGDQAFQLFEAIFAPVQQEISLPEKLIIVPDGTLAYLPFECLLSERPKAYSQFKSHHYLIRDYCFSYAYSATQQLELLQVAPVQLPNNLLAVAPVYEKNRYGLGPLRNNRPEAEAVCALFNGKLLEGEEATASTFLQSAGQYRILLLAMHGKASSTIGDMSYIAFSTGADTTLNPFLYARDLYTQSIPADLVVLSACETSVGAYRFGQGVISLAKGFFQAGARSVAATLWSVDDAKNATLMRLFFRQIKNGIAKDEALRNAKLEFLQSHPQDEAHPVFWAAVTAYGDMGALDKAQWHWGWLLGFGLLGLGSFFLWRWIRR